MSTFFERSVIVNPPDDSTWAAEYPDYGEGVIMHEMLKDKISVALVLAVWDNGSEVYVVLTPEKVKALRGYLGEWLDEISYKEK